MPCAKCVSAVQGVEKLLLRVYTYTACGHGCFEMKKRAFEHSKFEECSPRIFTLLAAICKLLLEHFNAQ